MENTNNTPNREEVERIALTNLNNDYITSLAAAKMGTSEKYGKILSNVYADTIRTAPDQATYEQLFLEGLSSEEGFVSNAGLKDKAAKIAQESLMSLSVAEAVKYAGAEMPITQEYAGKYVEELSDEQKTQIMGVCMTSMVHKKAESELVRQRGINAGGLEQIFCGRQVEETAGVAA